MRRRRTAAGFLAVSSLMAACSLGDDDSAGSDVTQGDETCDSVDLDAPPESPVNIRTGHGAAAEEPLWLMEADDEVTTHEGSWYTMDFEAFRGTADRLTAYQAGDLDAVTISPQAQIEGTASGALDLYAVATIMREGGDGFSTSFVAEEGSGIDSVDDLQGRTIAIVDEGSQLDFLARQGVAMGGGDPDADAEYVVVPFPSQEESLRAGQIDVAGIPEPFYTMAMQSGGLVDVFDGSDVSDVVYDLLTVSFDRQFVEDNVGAVCAWAADYAAGMDRWLSDEAGSRELLADSEFVTLPLDVYSETGDYERPEGGEVDVEGMEDMIDQMVEFGIFEDDDLVDPETMVRDGVSLGQR